MVSAARRAARQLQRLVSRQTRLDVRARTPNSAQRLLDTHRMDKGRAASISRTLTPQCTRVMPLREVCRATSHRGIRSRLGGLGCAELSDPLPRDLLRRREYRVPTDKQSDSRDWWNQPLIGLAKSPQCSAMATPPVAPRGAPESRSRNRSCPEMGQWWSHRIRFAQ